MSDYTARHAAHDAAGDTTTEPTYDELIARVAELERELASRPKRRASSPRKPATEACQYCSDVKSAKVNYLGLPLCAEWKPCASRQHRAKGVAGYGWDRRYSVRPSVGGRWVVRFDGQAIGMFTDRAQARRFGYDHRNGERASVAA